MASAKMVSLGNSQWLRALILTSIGLFAISCAKQPDTAATATGIEDTSASGVVVSSIGSALASSSSNGNVAIHSQKSQSLEWQRLLFETAQAAGMSCPTIVTSNGAGCANESRNNGVDLIYSTCSFGNSGATWNGTMEVSLSSGSISCGTFPLATTLTSNNFRRQFVSTGGAPSTGNRTSAFGTVVTVDHASSNLANFDGDAISALLPSGFGQSVTFDGSGHISNVAFGEHLTAVSSGGSTLWDHSVSGSLAVSEASGVRTISTGSVSIYHNLLKVVGTTTLSNITYQNSCCYPLSGSVTTAFTAGTNVNPTVLGQLLVGKSESLAFGGTCGSATYTDTTGTSKAVTLANCL